jgi:threonine dehydratase
MSLTASLPTYADVEAAARRIAGGAHRTPALTSRTLDAETGARVVLKCENLQRSGAFKFRGALNALLALTDAERARGVLTYSSGNHAGALALAGREYGVAVTVVMPDDAPRIKRAAVEGYGARIVTYNRATDVREEIGRAIAEREGSVLIPPYDHPAVVAGAGTAARELIEDRGPFDVLVACVGGGGLLSGTALAARELLPSCEVWGVEPETADDAKRSLETGTLQTTHEPATIADGARTPYLGETPFALIQQLATGIATVSDDELMDSLRFLLERFKLVAEPTGVLGLAAVRTGELDVRGKRVGVIISGGNADLAQLLCG